MAGPRSYEQILHSGHVLGRDFRIAFGDSKVERCLLVAPHGGGIEPGTSEIMRTVAELGGWAWYEFAGFLRQGNKESLHVPSTAFDEPTLTGLVAKTAFVISFHGAGTSGDPLVHVGGRWKVGRRKLIDAINKVSKEDGITAEDVTEAGAAHLQGLDESNITNRGLLKEGVQLEFSRGARNMLFPPDASREARGRRSTQLRLLASAIHEAIDQLTRIAAEQPR